MVWSSVVSLRRTSPCAWLAQDGKPLPSEGSVCAGDEQAPAAVLVDAFRHFAPIRRMRGLAKHFPGANAGRSYV